MPGRLGRFAPRVVPTVFAAAVIVVFAVLGLWQVGRAEVKQGLTISFDAGGPAIDWKQLPPGAPRYQRVRLGGHYDSAHQFLLDNRSHESVAGVEVLTPFFLDDGTAVIINRGWLPFGPTRQDLPDVVVGDERRTVVGRIDDLPRPGIWLKAPPATGWPRLVQYPNMDELAAALGRKLAPRQVLLDPGVPDGYVRAWTVAGTSTDRHIGYAVQWFAFAAVAGVLWFVLSFRKPGEST